MRRTGRAACIVALALLGAGPSRANPDDRPRPASPPPADPGAVDGVLAEWQANASATTSLDVRFRMTDDSSGNRKRYEGRAVLATPDRGSIEWWSLGDDGKVSGLDARTVWDGRTILRFDPQEHRVLRLTLPDESPTRLGLLRLPFLFRMTAEGARRDHDWALVGEQANQVALQATPRARAGAPDPIPTLLVVLDRKTFLPRRFRIRDRDGRSTQAYEVLEVKRDAIGEDDPLLNPCLDAWTIRDVDGPIAWMLLK